MFYGDFDYVLDEKNRVAVPAPFREAAIEKKYGKGFYVGRGTTGCLFLFTPLHWEEYVGQIKKLEHKDRLNMEREVKGTSRRLECDPQGRIIIPQKLKEWAGLDRNIVLAGIGNRIEIWDAAVWEQKVWGRKEKEALTEHDRLIEKLLGGAES